MKIQDLQTVYTWDEFNSIFAFKDLRHSCGSTFMRPKILNRIKSKIQTTNDDDDDDTCPSELQVTANSNQEEISNFIIHKKHAHKSDISRVHREGEGTMTGGWKSENESFFFFSVVFVFLRMWKQIFTD